MRARWAGDLDHLLVYHRGVVTCEWHGDQMDYRYIPGEGEAIYDGDGNVVDTLTMQYPGAATEDMRHCGYYGLAGDVWGDSRDEVLLFGARGACIYANARPLQVPTWYNETLYPGV